MERFVYVDTETTDKVPGQIAQLAYIHAGGDSGEVVGENFYFTVGSMSPGAEAIHHLSPAVLKGLSSGFSFDALSPIMQTAFTPDRTFVAHNAAFDLKFVRAELERCGLPPYQPKVVCTMQTMTPICKLKGQYGKYKWPKVEEALRWLKIDQEEVLARARELFMPNGGSSPEGALLGFHDARYDVTAVMMIHQWLRKREKVTA